MGPGRTRMGHRVKMRIQENVEHSSDKGTGCHFCLNQFSMMKSRALTGCLKLTEASSAKLLKGDPFSFHNFMVVVTHV